MLFGMLSVFREFEKSSDGRAGSGEVFWKTTRQAAADTVQGAAHPCWTKAVVCATASR
jgi:hypothetical protein